MPWIFLLAGSFWLTMAAVGGALALSPRRRQADRTLALPRSWGFSALVLTGIGTLIAGLTAHPGTGLMLVCMAPVIVLGIVQRKVVGSRPDLPPPMARMYAVPFSPVDQILHPVRTARAQWSAFGHPFRSMRELRQWQDDRREDDGPA